MKARIRFGVAALLFALGADVARAATDSLTIDVDARQNVTIAGSSESLHEAVAALCARAGVALMAYEADDRAISVSYRGIALSDALARLLRSEVYLAGVRADERGGTQVTWLRVTGSIGGPRRPVAANFPGVNGAEVPVSRRVASIDLGVAPRIVETALSSDDVTARGGARRAIILSLREDRAALERYLARDSAEVIDELVVFPHAAELLQSLEGVTADSSSRTLLRGLTHELRVRQEADRRKAEREGEPVE